MLLLISSSMEPAVSVSLLCERGGGIGGANAFGFGGGGGGEGREKENAIKLGCGEEGECMAEGSLFAAV